MGDAVTTDIAPFVRDQPTGMASPRCLSLGRGTRDRSAGQPDAHRGSPSDLALDRNGSAVLLDDLLDRRQAQSRAEAFGAEQRLENLRQDIRADPRTRVLDHDLGGGAGGGSDLDLAFGAVLALNRLHRVIDEIDEDAPEAFRVERHDRAGRGQPPLQANSGGHGKLVENLVEPTIEFRVG